MDGRLGKVAPHVLLAERIANQQRTVGMGQTDSALQPYVDLSKQPQEVFNPKVTDTTPANSPRGSLKRRLMVIPHS